MALGSSSEKKALGRYVLASELHKSLFGSCWIARIAEGDDDGLALVRRISFSADVDEASLEAVAAAAEFATTLEHESLIEVLGTVRDDEELGVASAHQEAEPLRGLLRAAGIGRKPAPPPIALCIARDLLETVAYLHDKTFAGQAVLAALAPDNVLLCADGKAMLLEPVVSTAAAAAPAWKTQPKRACYDAPELLQEDSDADGRADLFTLGVLLWEMLRNRPLFGGSTYDAVAERVKSAAIRRADSLKPAGGEPIPKSVADIVEKALQRDPAERFQSAAEMLEAIAGETVASHQEVVAYVADVVGDLFNRQRSKVKQARTAKASAPAATAKAALSPPRPPSKSAPPMSKSPASEAPPSAKATMLGMAPPPAPGKGDSEAPGRGDSEAPGAPDVDPPDAESEAADKPAQEPAAPATPTEEPNVEPPDSATESGDEPADTAADAAADTAADTAADASDKPADEAAMAPPPAKSSGANLAASSGAVSGGGYDMLSIADDPSVDEELPDVAIEALAAASKKKDDPPGNTTMLLAVGGVVLIAVVIGAYAMSGSETAPAPSGTSSASGAPATVSTSVATQSTAQPAPATSATESASESASADEDADAGTQDAGSADAAAVASAEPSAAPVTAPPKIKTRTKPKTWPKPKTSQPEYTPGGI